MFNLSLTKASHSLIPLTLLRIAIGLFFFSSGFNKVFVSANQLSMLATITGAGIPFPHVMAPFVSICEMVGGGLLALGCLSRLMALLLIVISTVALLTVGIKQIPAGLDVISWYSWLLYLPEVLYILILFQIIVMGGGPLSLEGLCCRFKKNS